jgi:hypothetical protein
MEDFPVGETVAGAPVFSRPVATERPAIHVFGLLGWLLPLSLREPAESKCEVIHSQPVNLKLFLPPTKEAAAHLEFLPVQPIDDQSVVFHQAQR